MAPLPKGGRLELRSRESSVREDLPAWCRLVGHALESVVPAEGGTTRFLIAKGMAEAAGDAAPLERDLEAARRFQWSARVKWSAGMAATSYVRNHAVAVGQPASFDTADAAPSAIELLLTALGGCLAVGFQWRASRRGIAVHQLEVSLQARLDDVRADLALDSATGHPGLAAIEGALWIDCDADDATLQALFADTLARSPVAQSLLRGVPLRIAAKRA